MAEHSSMASRAAKAGAWTVGTRLAAKLIDFAMLLCLARFLGPAEFGLVAMAMAAVYIAEALFELPTAAALIRVPELTPELLHTAFTLSLLRGLFIALLLLAVAWPLAAFNNEPRLAALLAALALAPAMRGLVNPRMVGDTARALDFRPDAVMEVSGKAVALIVSVTIAIVTRSYWAIAAATVCAPLVATVLSYFIAPLRPRLTLVHWPQFSNLLGWNFLSQVCQALNWQIDRLLLPRLTTTVAFGQYAMGKQMSEIPVQALIQPLIRPSCPRWHQRVRQGGRATCSCPRHRPGDGACHGAAAGVARAPGRVALGPDWAPAAQWLQGISFVALLWLPGLLMAPLAMTLDRTRWMAVRTFVELMVRLPLVWLGAVHYGIPGAIAGSAIATAVGTVISCFVVRRLIDTSLTAQFMTLWWPMVAMVPAGAVLWFAKPALMAAAGVGPLLLWAVPVGVLYLVVYGLAAWLAWRLAGRPAGLEQHLLDIIRKRFFLTRNRSGSPLAARMRSSTHEAMEAHVEQPH